MTTDRDYFPQPQPERTLVLIDAHLLLRPPLDAPTAVEIVAAVALRGDDQ